MQKCVFALAFFVSHVPSKKAFGDFVHFASCFFRSAFRPGPRRLQTAKKVPSSRHVRMDGTHTGKLSAESVRAALRRVRGSALNFVPRDCEAEARPADETAEAEQGQRSAFCKPAATGAAKAGNRNHQGEGISVARLRAEMGSPWSVALLRHAEAAGAFSPGGHAFVYSR